jgi:hypothetical protein
MKRQLTHHSTRAFNSNPMETDPALFANLSFSQFKAYFRVLEPLHLPTYTGSTFRGALGHAMRKLHYGLKEKVCTKCEICSQCRYTNLYAYFFESPAEHPFIADNSRSMKMKHETYPQPFILEPPAGGLYLYNQAMDDGQFES